MSDYRHDIYGPKGLSQLSGLYTVKSHALESVNDDEIKAETLMGKNFIGNSKPYTATQGSFVWCWNTSSKTSVSEVLFVKDEYINFIMNPTGAPSLTNAFIQKRCYSYAQSTHIRSYYAEAKEFEDLIPSTMTMSYEIKSDIPFSLTSGVNAKNRENIDLLNCFTYAHEYSEPVDEWTKVVITDTITSNFRELFHGNNTYTSNFTIQISTIDGSDSVGNIYVRNVQLEYGDEATEYKMSDKDRDNVFSNYAIPHGSIDITSNTASINVSQYETANVNVEFPPSSYSTATMTIIHNNNGTAEYGCPNIVTKGDDTFISPFISVDSTQETKTYTLILYNGSATISRIAGHDTLFISNLVGNIVESTGGNFVVTGDCGFTC